MGDRGLPCRFPAARAGAVGCRRAGRASRSAPDGRVPQGERQPGKSDQIDALAIARAVSDGIDEFPVAYLDEPAMEIRLLLDHRHDLVVERTRIVNRLRWHLLILDPELERSVKAGSFNQQRVLDRVDRQLRRMCAGERVGVAREQLARIRAINRQAEQLKLELHELVRAHRPELLAETGCGPLTAAILIGRTAGAQQFRTDASFALQSGTAPIPCSSGQRTQHRLNRGGDRTQPRAAHHRDHPRQSRPRHQAVPRAQTSRRQDHQRRAALPQTPPRQTVPPPPRPTRYGTTARSQDGG